MIDFTLEDLLQWDELSPSLQKKFDMMTKEEIENFFKDGGFLNDLMKKYTFLNLPPKIGYGKNTTINAKFIDGGSVNETPIEPTPKPKTGKSMNVYNYVYPMRDKDGIINLWYVAYIANNYKVPNEFSDVGLFNQKYDEKTKTLSDPVKITIPCLPDAQIERVGSVYYNTMVVHNRKDNFMYLLITKGSSNPNDWTKIKLIGYGNWTLKSYYVDISNSKVFSIDSDTKHSTKHSGFSRYDSINFGMSDIEDYDNHVSKWGRYITDVLTSLSQPNFEEEDPTKFTQNELFKNYKGNFKISNSCIIVDKDEKEIMLAINTSYSEEVNVNKIRNPYGLMSAYRNYCTFLVVIRNVDFNKLYKPVDQSGGKHEFESILGNVVTDFTLLGSSNDLYFGYRGLQHDDGYFNDICTTYNEKYKEIIFIQKKIPVDDKINRNMDNRYNMSIMKRINRNLNQAHNSWHYLNTDGLDSHNIFIKYEDNEITEKIEPRVLSNKPISTNISGTSFFSAPAYKFKETSFSSYTPPFIMSDKSGNINMWYIARDIKTSEPIGLFCGTIGGTSISYNHKKINPACFNNKNIEIVDIIGMQYEAIFVATISDVKKNWYMIKTNGSSKPSEWVEAIDITDMVSKQPDCVVHWVNGKYGNDDTIEWMILRLTSAGGRYRVEMYNADHKKNRYIIVGENLSIAVPIDNNTLNGVVFEPFEEVKANFDWLFYIKDPNVKITTDNRNILFFVDIEAKMISIGIRINITKDSETKSMFLLFHYVDTTIPFQSAYNLDMYKNNIFKDYLFGWGLCPEVPHHRELSGTYDSNLKTFNIAEHLEGASSGSYIMMNKSECSIYLANWTHYPWNKGKKGIYVSYGRELSDGSPDDENTNKKKKKIIKKYSITIDTFNIYGKTLLVKPSSNPNIQNITCIVFNDATHKNRRCTIKEGSSKLVDNNMAKDMEVSNPNSIRPIISNFNTLWAANGSWPYKLNSETSYEVWNKNDAYGRSPMAGGLGVMIRYIDYKDLGKGVLLPIPAKRKEDIDFSNTDLYNKELYQPVGGTSYLFYNHFVLTATDLIYGFRERSIEPNHGVSTITASDVVCFNRDGKVIHSSPVVLDEGKYGKANANITDTMKKLNSDRPPEIFRYYSTRIVVFNAIVKDDDNIYVFAHIIPENIILYYAAFIKYTKSGRVYKAQELPLLNKYKRELKMIRQPVFGYNDRYGWFVKFELSESCYICGYNEPGILIISSKDTLEGGSPYTEEEFFSGKYYTEFYPRTIEYVEIIEEDDEDSDPKNKRDKPGYEIAPTPVFLGGYYTDFPGASGDLIDNAINYIYLYRDKVKWREVKVEVTKTPYWIPPLKNNKPYSDPLKFDKVLIATVMVKNKKVVNKTLYPVGDNYLYLNFNIKH